MGEVQGKIKEMMGLMELKHAIWNFFIKEFYINLNDINFETSDDSEFKNFDIVLMVPVYSKNLLRKDDLEKIINFFTKELKMLKTYHDHVDLRFKNNLSYTMVFYYDINEYLVYVFITYFRNNNDEFYFLDSILIMKKRDTNLSQ